jgi:hypothetical protein
VAILATLLRPGLEPELAFYSWSRRPRRRAGSRPTPILRNGQPKALDSGAQIAPVDLFS